MFLQCALYTVHCAIIMHSREPSFVITPAILGNTVNPYFSIYAAIKFATSHWNISSDYRDINTVKNSWFRPCTGWNRVVRAPIRRLKNDFDSIQARSQWGSLRCYLIHLWRHKVAWDCDAIADVDNGWGECVIPIGDEIYAWSLRFTSYFVLLSWSFCIPCYKRIKNACPWTVEIRGPSQ